MSSQTPDSQSPTEIEKSLAALQQQVAVMMANMQSQTSAETDLMRQMRDLETAFRKQYNALNTAKQQIAAELWDERKALRATEAEIESQKRALNRAQLLEQQRQQTNELYAEFDKHTAGLAWREWALPHQISGAKALAVAQRGILADLMGLGKTLTSLIWADMLGAKRVLVIAPKEVISNFQTEAKRWAPHRYTVAANQLPKLTRDLMFDMLRAQTLANEANTEYTVFINYEAWRRDKSMLNSLVELRFDAVILDEAHNVKNVKTSAFKGVEAIVYGENKCPNCGSLNITIKESTARYSPRKFIVCGAIEPLTSDETLKGSPNRRAVGGCGFDEEYCERPQWYTLDSKPDTITGACSIQHVLPMTGTTILNKPQDLFALLTLIDKRNFMNENQFLYDYCRQDFITGKWSFGSGGQARLVNSIATRYVARNRHDAGIELPPQTIQYHTLTLENHPQQAAVETALKKHSALLIDSDRVVPVLYQIALITRQRQAMTLPGAIALKDPEGNVVYTVNCNESVKLDHLIAYTNGDERAWDGLLCEITQDGDMAKGDRVALFSQFKTPLHELQRRLNEAGITNIIYDGDTPEHVAHEIKRNFDVSYNEAPKWQVVLCNYKAAGIGLNLTAATQMVILDEAWNPGSRDQAYARIDRMGQTKETTVHVLRVAGSIDTWMAQLIEEKQAIIDGVQTEIDLRQEFLKFLRDEN